MKIKLPDELDFLRVGRLPQKSSSLRVDDKVVFLTGATNGIGYVTARLFASRGATLIILVRNENSGIALIEELKAEFGTKSSLYIADFERPDQVSEAIDQVLEKEEKIDILINNAGAHRTVKKILDSNIEATFTVNHLASFLITKKLLPLIEKGSEPRIININS